MAAIFPYKLALMASLSNVKLKRIFTLNEAIRANLHGNKRILKWRPFWNKVYKGKGTPYLTSEVPLLSREYSPKKPTVRSFYPLFPSVLRFKSI